MNKKILIKILIIAVLFILILMAYKLVDIYAVFYSEGQAIVSQSNATWKILVNNLSISSQSSNTFNVDTFEMEDSTHVLDGKIAPGVTGYFYIEIDPGQTDVSIKYSITLDETQMSNDKMKIVSLEEIESDTDLILEDETTYTGVISLSDIQAGKKAKIKVLLTWENDEQNNEQDTNIGTNKNYKINLPISVKVVQYLGEPIEEYVPVDENVT